MIFNWGIKDTVTAANAGMDLEMPNTYYYGKKLLEAVHFGSVSEKVIDEAALRIVRTLLAHEEKIRQYGKIDAERQLWDDRQLAKKKVRWPVSRFCGIRMEFCRFPADVTRSL